MTLRRMPVIEHLDHSGLLALGAEWDALLADSPVSSPFLTWAWIGAWLETIGQAAEIVVSIARDSDSGQLLGVAPFYVAPIRRGGIPTRELRMIGAGRTAPDHLDMIVRSSADHSIAGALWAAVDARSDWDLIDLDGVDATGHLARLVLRRGSDDPEQVPVPYLPLSEDWSAVEARFGKSHRTNIARYARKLRHDATAAVAERMVTEQADLAHTMTRLIEMHQAVRTAKGDPGLFADPATTQFLRLAAQRLLDAGRLRMWRLDVGGEAIAVIWCMRAGDTVAFYATGFDASWSAYGPGRHIMARAIQAAAAEGATEFDFLRGDEAYKRSWGTAIRHDLRLRRPSSRRGRLVWAARSVARLVRRGRRVDA